MPEILSLALFERDRKTLVTRRKSDRSPFAGLWLLPAVVAGPEESAEEVLQRHVFHELGVGVEEQEFADTLYLEDAATHERYVANVFRIAQHEHELRFRAAGDYQDARWLTVDELEGVPMPPRLREWLAGSRQAPAPAAVPLPATGPEPDNRTGWNTIARAYQERMRLPTDRLVYAPHCPSEDELGLLGDISGLQAIVLGCGGGQDCIALAKQGAQVVGIDLSDRQIEYGRRLAEREGVFVTLLQGSVESLDGVEDESQDVAVSAHAMNYVERADRAFAEAHRVLRPGAPLVFSVHHPFDACLEDGPPYGVVKSYWQREVDWKWDFPEQGASGRMRSWYRPVSEWCSLLVDAGFRIDRVLEPPPVEEEQPWDRGYRYDVEKMRLIPGTLIVRAVKP